MPSSAEPPLARATLVATLVLVAATPHDAAAQSAASPSRSWLEATTGSALEEYLRAMQLDTARSRPYPQSIRAFGPGEVRAMLRDGAGGPWDRAVGDGARRAFQLTVLRPGVRTVLNSTFPFGINDGALWAGRGVSAAVDVGAELVLGPLSVRLQPILVWSQNAAFPLANRTMTGAAVYRDPGDPTRIDQPERFGPGPWHRVDYGESEVRLDLFGVTAGLSNMRQTWGPATTHALVLGPNAPGFAHLFVGTSRPLPIGIGRLHTRIITGRLDQTEWSPAPDSLARRLAAGIVASFLPWRSTSFEIGGTRFFHRRWTTEHIPLSGLGIPLKGYLLKSGSIKADDPQSPEYLPDNQLGSIFVRWAPTGSKTELYAEYARNDAALNLREVITEPDHQSAYALGARHLFAAGPARARLARFEWVNARTTHLHRLRPQGAFYSHDVFTQGHTNLGKVLGSVAVPGGGGFTLAVDEYDERGRTTLEFHRLGRSAVVGEGAPTADSIDVQYALGYQRSRFVRGWDVTTGATAVWELDRDFARRNTFNLGVQFGIRFGGAPSAPKSPPPALPAASGSSRRPEQAPTS